MLHLRFRNLSNLYSYQVTLKDDKIRSLIEVPFEDIKKQSEDYCIDSYDITGLLYKFPHFLGLPTIFSSKFIKMFCCFPLKAIFDMLKKGEVRGRLIRFRYSDQIWVTDGEFVTNYIRDVHDKMIEFTTSDTKYFIETAKVIGSKMLNLIIVFLKQQPGTDVIESNDDYSRSDPDTSSRYANTIYWEVIQRLIPYYYYLISFDNEKKHFVLLLLVTFLLSELKLSLEDLSGIIQFVTYNMFTLYQIIELLASCGIRNEEKRFGEFGYFIMS